MRGTCTDVVLLLVHTNSAARSVEKIEIFDELEEWYLIQAHYCLVIAVTDRTLGHEDVARKWRALAAELESSTD
jgi:hypothetical protein